MIKIKFINLIVVIMVLSLLNQILFWIENNSVPESRLDTHQKNTQS